MQTHDESRGGRPHRGVMHPVRVFLVDDHQTLRDGLAARLALDPGLQVIGGTTTQDHALIDLVEQLQPTVITVEVGQISAGIGALLDRLAAAAPDAHLVALSGSHEVECAVEAARAGAVAWVPKESSIEHLIDILHNAVLGWASYPGEQLGEVLLQLRADIGTAHERSGVLDALQDRELEVLIAMVEGKDRAEIAKELRVSVGTVRTDTRNILTKLRVRSTPEPVDVPRSRGMRPAEHEDKRVVALVRPQQPTPNPS